LNRAAPLSLGAEGPPAGEVLLLFVLRRTARSFSRSSTARISADISLDASFCELEPSDPLDFRELLHQTLQSVVIGTVAEEDKQRKPPQAAAVEPDALIREIKREKMTSGDRIPRARLFGRRHRSSTEIVRSLSSDTSRQIVPGQIV
jgi:hypothetical protein